MSDTLPNLAKIELAEANRFLHEFRGTNSLAGMLFVFGWICVGCSLVLLLIDWPSKINALGAALIVPTVWFIALYNEIRSRRHFQSLKNSCLKLQEAGYQLGMTGPLRETIEIVNAECPKGTVLVDFNELGRNSRLF